MDAEKRRKSIIKILQNKEQPVSAVSLAEHFGVSRQIIVGDIALLRAGGDEILAAPRGYLLKKEQENMIRRKIACCHPADKMKDELYAIVDQGCTAADVIVEHPIYGQLTGELMLKSRYDVDQFIERCSRYKAQPLSQLTEGLHLHTVLSPDEASFLRVKDSLSKMGILHTGTDEDLAEK